MPTLLQRKKQEREERFITMSTNRSSPMKPGNVQNPILAAVSIAHKFSDNEKKKKVLKVSCIA